MYSYEEIDEHIQWLMNFMREEYPNDFELVIDKTYATVRSTIEARNFLRADLREPGGLKQTMETVGAFFKSPQHYNDTVGEKHD